MEFLFEYLMFLAQAATVVVALLIVMSSLARLGSRGQPNTNEGRLRIHKLNDRMRDLKYSLESSVIDSDLVKKARKQEAKEESKKHKKAKKEHLIPLLEDFGVPTKGSKEELSTLLSEQLHYETNSGAEEEEDE